MWLHICNCHDSGEAGEDRAKVKLIHLRQRLCCTKPINQLQMCTALYCIATNVILHLWLLRLWRSMISWSTVWQCLGCMQPAPLLFFSLLHSLCCSWPKWNVPQCTPPTHLPTTNVWPGGTLQVWLKYTHSPLGALYFTPPGDHPSHFYDLTAFGAIISVMDASQTTFTFSGESGIQKVKVQIDLNLICVIYH